MLYMKGKKEKKEKRKRKKSHTVFSQPTNCADCIWMSEPTTTLFWIDINATSHGGCTNIYLTGREYGREHNVTVVVVDVPTTILVRGKCGVPRNVVEMTIREVFGASIRKGQAPPSVRFDSTTGWKGMHKYEESGAEQCLQCHGPCNDCRVYILVESRALLSLLRGNTKFASVVDRIYGDDMSATEMFQLCHGLTGPGWITISGTGAPVFSATGNASGSTKSVATRAINADAVISGMIGDSTRSWVWYDGGDTFRATSNTTIFTIPAFTLMYIHCVHGVVPGSAVGMIEQIHATVCTLDAHRRGHKHRVTYEHVVSWTADANLATVARIQSERDAIDTVLTAFVARRVDGCIGYMPWFALEKIIHNAVHIHRMAERVCAIGILPPRMTIRGQVSANRFITDPGALDIHGGQKAYKNSDYAARVARQVFSGRIVVDLRHFASVYIHGDKSYNLDTLYTSVVGTEEHVHTRTGEQTRDAHKCIAVCENLMTMELARELAVLCKCPMTFVLSSTNSKLVDSKLVAEFYAHKYFSPSLPSYTEITKRRSNHYLGGKVLDVIPGRYDTLSVFLDVKSMYPSIICERNLCFTTVVPESVSENSVNTHTTSSMVSSSDTVADDADADDDEDDDETNDEPLFVTLHQVATRAGILPLIMRQLVDSRTQVVSTGAAGDIARRARKIIANAMYGTLAFAPARFYSYDIATEITRQGRSVLDRLVAAVQQHKSRVTVVYGDTDSIGFTAVAQSSAMDVDDDSNAPIYTHAATLLDVSTRIINEIERTYTHIRVAIDRVFLSMLILAKKRYTGLYTLHSLDDIASRRIPLDSLLAIDTDHIDYKGLEIVRRDYAPVCKSVGRHVIAAILDVTNVASTLNARIIQCISDFKEAYDAIDTSEYLSEFVIHKQLSRAPSAYIDTASARHAIVAKRMQAVGMYIQDDDIIPYVYAINTTSVHPLVREFHPDEVTTGVAWQDESRSNNIESDSSVSASASVSASGSTSTIVISKDWYVANQIYPFLARLCAPIADHVDIRAIESIFDLPHGGGNTSRGHTSSLSALASGTAADPDGIKSGYRHRIDEECIWPNANLRTGLDTDWSHVRVVQPNHQLSRPAASTRVQHLRRTEPEYAEYTCTECSELVQIKTLVDITMCPKCTRVQSDNIYVYDRRSISSFFHRFDTLCDHVRGGATANSATLEKFWIQERYIQTVFPVPNPHDAMIKSIISSLFSSIVTLGDIF